MVDPLSDGLPPDELPLWNPFPGQGNEPDSFTTRGVVARRFIKLALNPTCQELYTQDYYSIHWAGQSNNVCEVDLYAPHSSLLDGLNLILIQYERCSLPPLRRVALKRVYDLILAEDDNTDYHDSGAVSKMMNLIVRWYVDGPESAAFKKHRRRRADFMWLGKEGMMMTGTNGSQLWDLAFIS